MFRLTLIMLHAILVSSGPAVGLPLATDHGSTLAVPGVSATRAGSAPLASQSQKFEELMGRAVQLLQRGQYVQAVAAFKEANNEAGGRSAECLLGLALTFNRMEAYENAAKEARRAIEVAPDSRIQAQAYFQLGQALVNRGEDDVLDEAEIAFRAVLDLTDGGMNAARFLLAKVLVQQARIQEANVLLDEYLGIEPDGPYADLARAIIENPRYATETASPDFSLITLDGEYMTLDDLRGKVVLLAFWATWCPICRSSIPTMKELSKRMEEDPFVLISVSAEARQVIEEFVEENDMTWPQVQGRRSFLNGDLFGISAVPTYFLIDHEGFVLYTTTGWSDIQAQMITSDVSEAIKNAKEAQQQRPPRP